MTTFFCIGIITGIIGTIAGVGGGFLLMPALMLMFPEYSPSQVTAISLAVIAMNGLSAIIAFLRLKKINVRLGLLLGLCATPGAFMGAVATKSVDRATFAPILAGVLLGFSLYLAVKNYFDSKNQRSVKHTNPKTMFLPRPRVLIKGLLICAVVGFFSTFLGIGGGIVYVPLMVYLLGQSVHIAAATSQLVLMFTSGAAVWEHLHSNTFQGTGHILLGLGSGVVIGAQIGARIASRLKPVVIIYVLSFIILIASLRIIHAQIFG